MEMVSKATFVESIMGAQQCMIALLERPLSSPEAREKLLKRLRAQHVSFSIELRRLRRQEGAPE